MAAMAGSNPGFHDRTEEFLCLLGQHDRALYAYIFALVHRRADADDLAQETRIRLWQQFDKYQPDTDFGAWARKIAYYQVLTHREKASRNRLQFGEAFYESVAAEVAARADLVASREDALLRCMEKLDSPKRTLLQEYYAEDRSLVDFAKQSGRSYESTRKTIYRSQLLLADCIESEMKRKGACQ
jgi:RNA polymerase sigma-70 factor (ECF subfamily)